jgi:G3E family GTPase
MRKPRLVLLGGFLGSGKTTMIVEIGERLIARGHTVAIVTNDQGEELVDTRFAETHGFAAGEVLNGCFCCNFSSFIANLTEIMESVDPEFILAEPVGSCTDLIATVVGPISLYHSSLVDLGPYLVLADGPRLAGEYREMNLNDPVTPREVLVSHQIREARRVLLTKCDLLAENQLRSAERFLRDIHPDAEIIVCSAHDGIGMDAILELVRTEVVESEPSPLAVDYQRYAEAEAEMGWYNGVASITAPSPVLDPEAIAFDLADQLRRELGDALIHGKALITTAVGGIKISVVGGSIGADTTIERVQPIETVGLTLNLRAAVDPDGLADRARTVLGRISEKHTAKLVGYRFRSVTPDAPVPVHRLGGDSNPIKT